MALFTQYAVAAAEEAMGDAGLLGMSEEDKEHAVGAEFMALGVEREGCDSNADLGSLGGG